MTSHLDDGQLSGLIDGELSLTERAAVLDHLAHCPGCARRQAELVEVTATLRAQQPMEWTNALTRRVFEQIQPSPASAPSRSTIPVAVALAGIVAALVFAVAPIAPVGPFLAGGVLDAVSALPPVGGASAGGIVAALVAVALLAPALLYPLARWR